MPINRTSASWRKLQSRPAAAFIDYSIVVPYLGLLSLVARRRAIRQWFVRPASAAPQARSIRRIATAAVTTFPVTAWLSAWECSRVAASPGKRLAGLHVTAIEGDRPSPARAIVRNVLKVAIPWELAHAGVWRLADDANDRRSRVLLASSLGLTAAYAVSALVGDGRTIYDRLTGSVVCSSPEPRLRARLIGR